jgi:hypothetical protein
MVAKPNINLEAVIASLDELQSIFGTNLAYANVSRTQLSIARHYGGCKIQCKHFIYNPTDDSLIREDVVKWLKKKLKKKSAT